MGFQDNSGDIILDVVLTDEGRRRLARGDGSFSVVKFALGDDEINYELYNATASSALQDLSILQTPVLEAFTNNRSSLKSRLITLTNNNLLYLPQLILNENSNNLKVQRTATTNLSSESFLIAVNSETQQNLESFSTVSHNFINGSVITTAEENHIRVDQGLLTNKLSAINQLSSELLEQQYTIEIDNRLGMITDPVAGTTGSPSFIDDDQIATYYVTFGVGGYVALCTTGPLVDIGDGQGGAGNSPDYEVIAGPRGTKLRFSIMASSNLKASDYLFDTIGKAVVADSKNYKVINSSVKITGVTTGYHIDIPITFAKSTT